MVPDDDIPVPDPADDDSDFDGYDQYVGCPPRCDKSCATGAGFILFLVFSAIYAMIIQALANNDFSLVRTVDSIREIIGTRSLQALVKDDCSSENTTDSIRVILGRRSLSG